MPASEQQIRRYKQAIAAQRTRTGLVLVAAWDQLEDYDEDDVARFERATAAPLAGARRAATSLSVAFFALATGTRVAAVDPAAINLEPRIRDPFLATWHALKEKRPWLEALAAGRSMAEAVGFNFVQSTARRAGDLAAEASGRDVRWQRVPGAESCDWCQLVAGQLYHSAESADFGHDRCDCDAVPA